MFTATSTLATNGPTLVSRATISQDTPTNPNQAQDQYRVHDREFASPFHPIPYRSALHRLTREDLNGHGPRVTILVEVDLAALATAERSWAQEHGTFVTTDDSGGVTLDWDEDRDYTYLDAIHDAVFEDAEDHGPHPAEWAVLGGAARPSAVWLAYTITVPA